MPSDRKPSLILPVAVAAMLLLAGYVGAYYTMLVRFDGSTEPYYRSLRESSQLNTGGTCGRFFAFAHWIDRKVTPDIWEFTVWDEFARDAAAIESYRGLLVGPRE